MHNNTLILAPLQGLTDAIYRKVYNKHFSGINIAITPYISLNENNSIKRNKIIKLTDRENVDFKIIPQLLTNKYKAIIDFSDTVSKINIQDINLNMGCPYPIVTKKQKGAGMLPEPQLINSILNNIFSSDFKSRLSLKLRLGLTLKNEIFDIINIINQYPISEITIHPRVGAEYYSGNVDLDFFERCLKISKHKVVYNGDIFSVKDYENMKQRFPEITDWMLGRGILQNPWLAQQIKGDNVCFTKDSFVAFHRDLLETICNSQKDNNRFPQRMKEYWWYFSKSFNKPQEIFDKIKSINTKEDYNIITKQIIEEYTWI